MEKLNGLRCRECGRHYPAAPIHVCEFCFGPLEVVYRYDALKGVVTRESIAAGPPSMWRYKELLPIDGDIAFDAMKKPVSVNNGFFQVCVPKGGTCGLGSAIGLVLATMLLRLRRR